jgi:hypothetical protein
MPSNAGEVVSEKLVYWSMIKPPHAAETRQLQRFSGYRRLKALKPPGSLLKWECLSGWDAVHPR